MGAPQEEIGLCFWRDLATPIRRLRVGPTARRLGGASSPTCGLTWLEHAHARKQRCVRRPTRVRCAHGPAPLGPELATTGGEGARLSTALGPATSSYESDLVWRPIIAPC